MFYRYSPTASKVGPRDLSSARDSRYAFGTASHRDLDLNLGETQQEQQLCPTTELCSTSKQLSRKQGAIHADASVSTGADETNAHQECAGEKTNRSQEQAQTIDLETGKLIHRRRWYPTFLAVSFNMG